MSSGRYTAYHIYQGLQFPEAEKAGTRPYKLPEYQCVHSQRGYHFQFDNMVERTHFDAANTTCCNEPVLNFANKPQYSESSKPMNAQDCGARVSAVGCNVLDVKVESTTNMCADAGAKIQRIRIGCAQLCPELAANAGGGTIKGQFGTFKVLGTEPGGVMVLDYVPDSDKISGWYDYCSGASAITEEFCGGHSISYYLQAGLDYPGECGCDCCGENGGILPPNMSLTVPSAIGADWSNTIQNISQISGWESCSGGTIDGTFSGAVGSQSVQWNGAAQYRSNGSTRYVTRDPVSIGSAGSSACCGGTIHWSGADGCGGGNSTTTAVSQKIGSSQIYVSPAPRDGDTLLTGGSAYWVSGWEACSYAGAAALNVTPTCLSNSIGSLQASDGNLARQLGSLLLSGTQECSGCCGSGSISVSFNNGCGQNDEASYYVRHDYSDTGLAGYMFRCVPNGPSWYKVVRTLVNCDGSTGGDDTPYLITEPSLSGCISAISGTGGEAISGNMGCSGTLPGGAQCCWYSDNGEDGLDFRSKVFAVSGSRCCAIDEESGAWVSSGTGIQCCPQK